MLTLALDTSQRKIVLALLNDQKILASHTDTAEDTANALLQGLDRLLKEAATQLSEIQNIIFGCGPGSFTSLRIGAATLWGLFGARENPPEICGVSSLLLRALSLENAPADQIGVAFKARQQKVYAGFWQAGQWVEHCLTFAEIQIESQRHNWTHKIGLAWPEILTLPVDGAGQAFVDPLHQKSFLKITDKSISYKEKLNKNIILNYLQPLSDVARRSQAD